MKHVGLDEARAAKEHARSYLATRVCVVGLGITRIDGGFGLKVNLGEPPGPDAQLPESLDGVPIRFEIVGPIRKRNQ